MDRVGGVVWGQIGLRSNLPPLLLSRSLSIKLNKDVGAAYYFLHQGVWALRDLAQGSECSGNAHTHTRLVWELFP